MPGLSVLFDFQRCPPVSIQDQQIRKPLYVVWVVLQYNASGKIFFNPPDQLRLKSSFKNIHRLLTNGHSKIR